MPSRHIVKIDAEHSYYHVYARGASKQRIYLEQDDYLYFMNLFIRYLSNKPALSYQGTFYPHYQGSIELLTFCIMPNHFHLLVYQTESGTMEKLMRSIMTSYSRYFNKKYKCSGSPFESRYKANMITTESYLEHISRYIHLNPRYWKRYQHSSLSYYFGGNKAEWIKPEKIIGLFSSSREYLTFLQDYEDHKRMLDEIKSELADN